MSEAFITISGNLLEQEHLCCAMTDKKHQPGVTTKKKWRSKLPCGCGYALNLCVVFFRYL